MSQFQIETMICDDDGTNCQAPVWITSTEIPVSDGWFGIEPGSPEYWDVVWSFGVLMATIWGFKAFVKFVRR